jgi:hypothetical protein
MLAVRVQRLRLGVGRQPTYRSDLTAPEELLQSIDKTLGVLGGDRQRPHDIVAGLACVDHMALAALRARAGRLRAGRVQLLGLPELTIGSAPNWHRDLASGAIAPRRHWSRIRYLDVRVAGDHKSLWELNRHQYLFAPALTWLADGSDAEFQLVQSHLSSWLDDNPPAIGVNWASSLEVAYRAITWCWLLWLLQDAPWSSSLLSRMGDAMERSGLHVERNLSLYFSPNTHLTGEALSLFYLALVLPRSRHASRWREKGSSILETWLARQIYPDGVYTEQAALYQRYTAEIYVHYARLAWASGQPVTAALTRSLNNSFDVLRTMASADVSLPMIGDDDGGQLLPLDQRSPEQIAGVLLVGATALNRPELAPSGACLPALSYALCGVVQTNAMLASTMPVQLPQWRDRYFPDGGVAVLRDDWSDNAAVAVIDAGPHGVLNCGHAHADALTMTLSLGAQPLFIDRGTLTYVGAERNEFRCTRSHNTVEFDGESSVTPLGPFQWGPRPVRASGELSIFESRTLFRAQAAGHVDSDRPSLHRRVVAHAPYGAWLVLDAPERAGLTSLVVRWQLAPGLMAAGHDHGLDILDRNGRLLAVVTILGVNSVTQSVREVSLRYGHRTPATVIEAMAKPATHVVTLVVPASGPEHAVRLSASNELSATICEWTDSGGDHQVWVPRDSGTPVQVPGGLGAAAQALWLTARARQASDSMFEPELAIAMGVSRLSLGEAVIVAAATADSAVGDVVAGRRAGRWAILSRLHPARTSESP